MEELRPCPFCGGYAHVDTAYSYYADTVIYCEGCGGIFSLDDLETTKEDLIKAWNRREEC